MNLPGPPGLPASGRQRGEVEEGGAPRRTPVWLIPNTLLFTEVKPSRIHNLLEYIR